MPCCGPTPKPRENAFNPDYVGEGLTLKFYARHDIMPTYLNDRVLFYEKELQKLHDYNPRDYYCTPRYTNQEYGWIRNDKLRCLQNPIEFDSPLAMAALHEYFEKQNKKMLRSPEASLYCRCKMAQYDDHWKIV